MFPFTLHCFLHEITVVQKIKPLVCIVLALRLPIIFVNLPLYSMPTLMFKSVWCLRFPALFSFGYIIHISQCVFCQLHFFVSSYVSTHHLYSGFFFFLFRIIILYPKIILTRNTLPVNQDSHTIHHSSISSRDLHSYIFQVQPLLFSSLINSYPLLF